jgi:hypothetical protein
VVLDLQDREDLRKGPPRLRLARPGPWRPDEHYRPARC